MITDFFNSTAVVKKETTQKTGMGGVSRTFTTRIASLPCRVSKRTSNEEVIKETDTYGKMTITEVFILYCEYTTSSAAIIESDQITVDGKIFEVKGIYNPGLLNRHLEITIMEVR